MLQDSSSQRSHRFTPAANYVIGLMDGKRTTQEIWELSIRQLNDEAPTQDEIIRLLSQLHSSDALQSDVTPDISELLKRYQKNRRKTFMQRFLNPMAFRIPLIDPDAFLGKTSRYIEPLFGKLGLLIWSGLVLTTIVLAGLNWSELSNNVTDRIFAPENLFVILLIFPLVKAVHEAAHAYATKIWGGEVHEIGIMLLVMMPIPYVDASAASSFRDKYKRVVVGSAGMIAELFLASLAMIIWVSVEPGVVRVVAYNVMLIAGISTLVFNSNPLLRFDGYYIFSDLIEIQNLATRSTQYIGFLFKRYVFKMKHLRPPLATKGERIWFVTYGITAFIYRMFIAFFIAMFVAGKFFFIGVLLAIWAIFAMTLIPFVKNYSRLLRETQQNDRKSQALVTSAVIAGTVVMVLTLVPVPSWTRAEGAISVPSESVVRAGADGFITEVVAAPDSYVHKGEVLITTADPELMAQIEGLKGKIQELSAQYQAEQTEDRVKAQITLEDLNTSVESLNKFTQDADRLTIRSNTDGYFIIRDAQDLPDKYLRKGQLVAYTLDMKKSIARVVVPQHAIDQVRSRTDNITIRHPERLDTASQARLVRVQPSATDEIPSPALARQGGGTVAVDPTDSSGVKAFNSFFLVDIEFPTDKRTLNVGGRVFVRFDHGFEPLASQWFRSLRQLFMERFNV